MISYDPFRATKAEKRISTYMLKNKYRISNSVLSRIRNDEPISLRMVNELCMIFECDISDIARYVPDEEEREEYLEHLERKRQEREQQGE